MNLNAVGQLAYCVLHTIGMFRGFEKNFPEEKLPSKLEAALTVFKEEGERLRKVYEEERTKLMVSEEWKEKKK